jgi:hypothetical protein
VVACLEPDNSIPWDGGLNSRRAHEPTRARVFYGASICPIFELALPRTRHLHVLHRRAIVQPSGSMSPFRLRAWYLPCVGIRQLGAEILPMESRHTLRTDPTSPKTKSEAAWQFRHLYKKESMQHPGYWRQSGVWKWQVAVGYARAGGAIDGGFG